MRASTERKTPGGKMIRLTLADGAGGRAVVSVDGDFFVDDAESVAALERALTGAFLKGDWGSAALAGVVRRCYETSGELVGADPECVAQAAEEVFGRFAAGAAAERDYGASRGFSEDFCSSGATLDSADAGESAGSGNVTTPRFAFGSATPEQGRKRSSRLHISAAGASGGGNTGLSEEVVRSWWRGVYPGLEVVVDSPRLPREQMAVEDEWSQEVARGERGATLRIWDWAAPAVVIGRFQSERNEVHADVAAAEGFAVVRRSTGGGAMFVEPRNTITYSLYVPSAPLAGFSVADTFRLLDGWAVWSLRRLGIEAGFGGLNDIVSPNGKIGGAAERRVGSAAVLHHTTLAYDIDAEKMARVLNVSPAKFADKAVKSAKRRVDPLCRQTSLSRSEIAAGLVEGLREFCLC